ncbi:hypothetical protein [Rhodococcus globerulus]|uniref:hypothetical protein n=1 Tax=Rhodococcus globerulus TaxID=33008 RepID=UPI001C56CCE4|nr:hypothetical protein [Rhodococcus globerulus]QXW04016.1 hypothetical protein KYT97_08350 [Rhodococcus globerulus]
MQFHRTIIAPAALDPLGQFGNRAARRHPRRDPEGHPNPNPAPNPAPSPEPNPAPKPAPTPTPPVDDWAKIFEGMTPAEVKEKLDHSRKWETRAKDNREGAEKWEQIQKAFTGEGGDTPPDPAKLATDLTASQRETRDTKVENAVFRLAPEHSANAVALIDSRSFMAQLDQLDPSAADFTDTVNEAIKTALAANAALATFRGPLPNPQQGNPGNQRPASGRAAGTDEADRRFGAKN